MSVRAAAGPASPVSGSAGPACGWPARPGLAPALGGLRRVACAACGRNGRRPRRGGPGLPCLGVGRSCLRIGSARPGPRSRRTAPRRLRGPRLERPRPRRPGQRRLTRAGNKDPLSPDVDRPGGLPRVQRLRAADRAYREESRGRLGRGRPGRCSGLGPGPGRQADHRDLAASLRGGGQRLARPGLDQQVRARGARAQCLVQPVRRAGLGAKGLDNIADRGQRPAGCG